MLLRVCCGVVYVKSGCCRCVDDLWSLLCLVLFRCFLSFVDVLMVYLRNVVSVLAMCLSGVVDFLHLYY